MRPSLFAALATLATVTACTSTVVTTAAPPPGGDPPAEPAPPAAEATCPAGQYAAPPARACAPLPKLSVSRATTTISPARDHHATFIHEVAGNPYLYVVAGTDAWRSLHDDVQRAPIRPDGTLGAFEPAGKLPQGRAGHCAIARGGHLFILGGVVGTTRDGPSATTLTARFAPDGTVVDVKEGAVMPTAVMHLSCEANGETLYVFGGRGRTSRSTTLSARAKMGADGSLGAFVEHAPLSPDRSHHASFLRDGRVYLLGGLTGDPTKTAEDRRDVVSAKLLPDGSIGPFEPAGTLAAPLSITAAVLRDDVVWVLGGYEGSGAVDYTDRVQRGTFKADGTIATFEIAETRLPEGRGHVHQTPVWKNHLYSVGGKASNQEPMGTIDIGTFE